MQLLRKMRIAVFGWSAWVMLAMTAGAFEAQSQAQEIADRLLADGIGPGVAVGISAQGAVHYGLAGRKSIFGPKLDLWDQWHLGSVGKSITTSAIAVLVSGGWLQWDQPVGDLWQHAKISDEWRQITLRMLLHHRAGLPSDLSLVERRKLDVPFASAHRSDREIYIAALARELPKRPDIGAFAYSNAGYVMAAAAAERALDAPFEQALRQIIFEPLGLSSARFGPPNGVHVVQGHRRVLGRIFLPVAQNLDNIPAMIPAGMVSMSLRDVMTYLSAHLRRDPRLKIDAKAWSALHQPNGAYAMGWLRDGLGGLWHNGSNGFWYALVGFWPERDRAIAILTNAAPDDMREDALLDILKNF